MTNYRRNKPLLIIYLFIKSIFPVISTFAVFYVVKNLTENKIVLVITYLLLIIYLFQKISTIFLKWYTFMFKVKDSLIYIKKGLFLKNEIILNPKSIKNIKVITPYLYNLFNVTKIVLETNITGDNSEILIEMLSKDDAKNLIKELKGSGYQYTRFYESKSEIDERKIIYEINKKNVIILSFFSQSFFAFLSFLVTIYFFINDNIFLKSFFKSYMTVDFIKKINLVNFIIYIIVLVFLYNIVINFIKYYNFSLKKNDGTLIITRGLIDERKDTLNINNIDVIKATSNVIMRYFNFLKAQVVISSDFTLPDGKRENETVLLPISKTEFLIEFINNYLFNFKIYKHKELKNNFILVNIYIFMILTILSISLYLSFKLLNSTLIFIVIVLIFLKVLKQTVSNSFAYFNISEDNKTVFISRVLFNSETYYINVNRIVEYGFKQNFIEKKLRLCTINILIRENTNKNIRIRFISESIKNHIESVLID